MTYRISLVFSMILFFSMNACLQSSSKKHDTSSSVLSEKWFLNEQRDTIHTLYKTDEQWKAELDAKSYYVLRQKGTERAFSGNLNNNKASGIYSCHACKLPLFSSDAKFDSGTGWPSFYTPIDQAHVKELADNELGMRRTEVLCRRCGGHLGHVFNDGPKPTGLRYCMNSVSLSFDPQ